MAPLKKVIRPETSGVARRCTEIVDATVQTIQVGAIAKSTISEPRPSFSGGVGLIIDS